MKQKGVNVAVRRERATERSAASGFARPAGDLSEPDAAAVDARLVAGIASGDHASLGRLYERRGGALHSMLLRMLNSESEAEDILQDTFVRIWRRAGDFDPARSAPFTWMVMIARGLAMSRLRTRGCAQAGLAAYQQEVASLEVEHISGWQRAENHELPRVCSDALQRLPEAQRRALELAFFRGWTHGQIASGTGEPLGTVKARIRRGLLALRGLLRDFHA